MIFRYMKIEQYYDDRICNLDSYDIYDLESYENIIYDIDCYDDRICDLKSYDKRMCCLKKWKNPRQKFSDEVE